jgi:hypothetical protein
MTKAKKRIRLRHFRVDTSKLSRVQEILLAKTETEAIERALDFVLSDHLQKQLAWEANDRFLRSGIQIKDVYGGLGTEISSRFKKIGLEMDIPRIRGIRPVTFGRRKKPR